MGHERAQRPSDKHIDNEELNVLAQWSTQPGLNEHDLSADVLGEAEHHVESCEECRSKVSEYQRVQVRISNARTSEGACPGLECSNARDIEWPEVSAGLWEEQKARQLILHAALCDHCGPRLRAATSVDDPTVQEERFLERLKPPTAPVAQINREPRTSSRIWRRFWEWKTPVPALALMIVIAVVVTGLARMLTPPPQQRLSGPMFAEFAVLTHRHSAGKNALDVRLDSQEHLNEWFRAKVPFPLTLPASPLSSGEERPYRLEGARLVPLEGKTAVYIAYQMQTGPVGLVVAPDSLAMASGGVEAEFKKLTFHYRTLEGYKVVTWSLHGKTYALVSQEGNSRQQSCMVCHSAMRDRDLTHIPTPLLPELILQQLVLQ
jgi:hypothetical protein